MNYSELKAAVSDWAHRSNIADATVDLFIDLAEAEFNNRLRCVEQETVANLVCSSRFTALPSGFLEMRAVEFEDAYLTPIPYDTPEYLAIRSSSQVTGDPRAYSLRGTDIELFPAPTTNTTIGLTYFTKIVALSDANTTNWLIDAHPNMYLLETLRQMCVWSKDDAGATRYANQLQGYWGALKAADKAKRYGGPLRVRVA